MYFKHVCSYYNNINNLSNNFILQSKSVMVFIVILSIYIQLVEILTDVKYLQSLRHISIPAAAMAVFEKRDLFSKVKVKIIPVFL